jgi:ATP-dependent DNA helicase RecQ
MNSFASLKATLRGWPDAPVPVESFAERPHERLRNLLRNFDENVGTKDLATLVRHVLRYEEMRHNCAQRFALPKDKPWPTADQWEDHGCRAREVNDRYEVEAKPWEPGWLTVLHAKSEEPAQLVPFAAAEVEEIRHPRLSEPEDWRVWTDPSLSAAFAGFTHYLSSAQAETVRAVMLSPPGSTRLIVLPTGGGKSLVGLANALLGKVQTGVALIIVPTIALAFDQVEQARTWRPEDSIDAWHSGLNKPQRQAIRQRLSEGTQRLLFLAPESLRGLKEELIKVATTGWLRSVVIDEAHLISQWGGSFRPEMQLMSATLRQLRETCPPGAEFRTLLMTATLTAETFADLSQLFGSMETLAAVHLRPEPDYFMARCQTEDEKISRVLDVLRHAPRPAILYVTKVEDAKEWHNRCRAQGWLRTGLLHGESSSAEREKAIVQWRENQLDLMVATSAFGLGMDKGDVRLVLHACVPETLDRFYQEVGRGGRDGRASLSIMVWTPSDLRLASRMSSATLISDELGLIRWKSMWLARTDHADISYLNLRTTRPGIEWDSDRNMEWNLRTILLLTRARVLELQELPSLDLARLPSEDDEDYQIRREKAWTDFDTTCAVRLLDAAPIFESSWQEHVGTYRKQSMQAGALNWQLMEDVLEKKRRLPDVLREVYRVPDAGIHDVALYPSEVEVPIAPKDLCRKLSLSLENATRTATNGLLIVTYQVNGIAAYDLLRTQISILKTLISHGVREIAVPVKWLERSHWDEHRNPAPDLARQSIEGFIILRDLVEPDPWDRQPDVPRASLAMPDTTSVPDFLYSLNRPLHLLIMPEDVPDPANSSRLIGAVKSNVMSIKDLSRLLQL